MHSFLKVPPQHYSQIEVCCFFVFYWAIAKLWFFFFLLQICCCVLDHCLVAWHNLGQVLAVGDAAAHLSLENFGIQRLSWSTQFLQSSQVQIITVIDGWCKGYTVNRLLIWITNMIERTFQNQKPIKCCQNHSAFFCIIIITAFKKNLIGFILCEARSGFVRVTTCLHRPIPAVSAVCSLKCPRLVWMSNTTLKHRATKFKCRAHLRVKSMAFEVDHPFTFW